MGDYTWNGWTLNHFFVIIIVWFTYTGLSECEHRGPINPFLRAPHDYNDSLHRDCVSPMTTWPGSTHTYYQLYTQAYCFLIPNGKYVAVKTGPPPGALTSGVCLNFENLNDSDPDSCLGVFVCPLPSDPVHHTYCCGNKFSEYCCGLEQVHGAASIAGMVLALVLVVFVMCCACVCCFMRVKNKKEEELMQGQQIQEVQGGQHPDEGMISTSRRSSITRSEMTSGRQSSRGAAANSSGSHTSCTSLRNSESDGDNGYGSGQLADTRALDPAYPPTSRVDSRGISRSPHHHVGHRDPFVDPTKKGTDKDLEDYHFSNPNLMDGKP